MPTHRDRAADGTHRRSPRPGRSPRPSSTGGEHVPFTTAVVATGAKPRNLDVPGSDLAGIHYLRSTSAIRAGSVRPSAPPAAVAVIGAGWIGSEVAASARQMGADVVLIDPAPAPLHRVRGDQIGDVFRRWHADNGVQLRLRSGVAELRGTDTVEQVVSEVTADVHPADPRRRRRRGATASSWAVAAGLKSRQRHRRRRAGCAPAHPACTPRATSPPPGTPTMATICASSTGPTPSIRASPPGPTPPEAPRPIPGCPISSPISTTWAWSTSATATRPTRSRSVAVSPTASSSPSGTATASSPQR